MTSRAALFAENLVRRVAERNAKRYITALCQGMSVVDFRYAAENGLNVLDGMLRQLLLKPGEEQSAKKKAAPYRQIVENLANTDTLVRLFTEVSPEHGRVVEEHRPWLERQIRSGLADVFGT